MYRRIWLVSWLIAIAFAANACAGKRIEVEPKPPEEHADAIKLDVYPPSAMANPTATIQLTIRIDPNPKNSYIEWSWDSDEGRRSSGHSIDGSSQKKFSVFVDLSPGEYEIRATLTRGDKSFSAVTKVTVTGGASPF